MNSWKVILATVVIFGTGVLTGGFLVNSVVRQHAPSSRPRSPQMWREDFIGHLDRDLKLTPEQHAAISKIIAGGQERNREIWTNVFPRLREEMEQDHQRIRAQLTPDQQKKFDEMVKQFASHRPPHNRSRPEPASPTNTVPPASEGGPTGP